MRETTERICCQCGKKFITFAFRIKHGRGKFCSKICHNQSRGSLTFCHCKHCGKQFKTKPHYLKRGGGKFCSVRCHFAWREINDKWCGETHPSWRGGLAQRICEVCGQGFEIARCEVKKGRGKFCSQKCYGKWRGAVLKGENSPSWRGGISHERVKAWRSDKYKLWRKTVFERDHFQCVICGEVGGNLNAHHIKSFKHFPALRYNIGNGITMCRDCHYSVRKDLPLFSMGKNAVAGKVD